MRSKSTSFGNRKKKELGAKAGNKKSAWRDVGTVFARKDGEGFFLKINENVTLEKGQILNLEAPQDRIERLFKMGYLDEEKAEERLERIPETVKFDVILPPPMKE